MYLLEKILSSDDVFFFCEEVDSETLKVSESYRDKKRKRDDLEEEEIEEWYTVCTGFFFNAAIMKKVPGYVECHNGKFCGPPRKV